MEERKFKISIVADEYYIADALREIAVAVENAEDDEELDGMEFTNKHYHAKIEL